MRNYIYICGQPFGVDPHCTNIHWVPGLWVYPSFLLTHSPSVIIHLQCLAPLHTVWLLSIFLIYSHGSQCNIYCDIIVIMIFLVIIDRDCMINLLSLSPTQNSCLLTTTHSHLYYIPTLIYDYKQDTSQRHQQSESIVNSQRKFLTRSGKINLTGPRTQIELLTPSGSRTCADYGTASGVTALWSSYEVIKKTA